MQWNEDPKVFVRNAFKSITSFRSDCRRRQSINSCCSSDYQLSLAIGKRGQNARLAAKLTGWKIDIKSETDAREAGIYPIIESEEVADEIVNTGDEDVEFDDVNLEESNLTTAELAAETDEETEEDKNTEE